MRGESICMCTLDRRTAGRGYRAHVEHRLPVDATPDETNHLCSGTLNDPTKSSRSTYEKAFPSR